MLIMKDSPNLNRKKTAGRLVAAAGFLMILANALDYLWGWDVNLVPLMIIGLGLVATGITLAKNR